MHEPGLAAAVGILSGNLIFLDDDTINAQTGTGPSRASKIGLRGVAVPCALATSKHKELIMDKKVYGSVTVAIAR
jgi:cobalt-precorrin 5A hydrolase